MANVILTQRSGRKLRINPYNGWTSFKQNIAGQTIVVLRSGTERIVLESLHEIMDLIHKANAGISDDDK